MIVGLNYPSGDRQLEILRHMCLLRYVPQFCIFRKDLEVMTGLQIGISVGISWQLHECSTNINCDCEQFLQHNFVLIIKLDHFVTGSCILLFNTVSYTVTGYHIREQVHKRLRFAFSWNRESSRIKKMNGRKDDTTPARRDETRGETSRGEMQNKSAVD